MSHTPGKGHGAARAAAAAVLLVLLTPAASAQQASSTAPGTAERLSVPGSISRWAYIERAVIARSGPSPSAAPVGKLGLRTEDGTDELVLLLERAQDAEGQRWVRARLPLRPVGSTGWVPESALGEFRVVRTWLRIDTAGLRATLVRDGHVVLQAPVGIGASRWPTPTGEFYIRNRLSGYRLGSAYGPLAFGTSAKSPTLTDWPGGGVVGLHGTNRPSLIPGRPSHGCVRFRNRDIRRLGRVMPVGTPVTIE